MSFDASNETGGASVETGAQADTGTIDEITSVGGTVLITNPKGPVVNLEIAGGGLFPGYGGAPPQIAAASSAGVALTVSRSDHTHAGVGSAIAGTGIGVSAATGAVTISNAGVLSIVAGAGINVSGATGNVTVSATAASFPGFGAAPPNVASSGAAGAAGTASRSDHTHGQDLSVVYVPSLAAAQASGVFQQTYAAPNATPAVLNVGTGLVPYGALTGTGILTTDKMRFFDTTNGLVVADTNPVPNFASPFGSGGNFTAIIETGLTALVAQMSRATTAGIAFIGTKSRGTRAAPATIAAGDTILNFEPQAITTGSPASTIPVILTAYIPADAVVSAGVVPMLMGFQASGTDGSINTATVQAQLCLYVDSRFNAYAGSPAAPGAAVDGFFYPPAMSVVQGTPVGVPTQQFGSTRAGNRAPTIMDVSNLRHYMYSGAWHFSQFYDYDPGANAGRIPFVGATTHTLTDSAALTFTTTASAGQLSVGQSAQALANGAAIIATGPSAPAGLNYAFRAFDNASGQGNIRADNWYFGGSGILPTLGTPFVLALPTALNTVFDFNYGTAADGSGGRIAAEVNTAGVVALGDGAGGKPGLQVIASTAGGAAADLALGYTGIVNTDLHGWPFMPRLGGKPTQAPAAFGNFAAFGFDAVNQQLWIRDVTGATWLSIPPFQQTAGAGAGAALINNAPAGVVSLTAKWWQFKDSVGTTTFIPYFQ